MSYIVGISANFHDSACCLFEGSELIAAAEEERISRIKHDSSLPCHAFRYCLEAGGIDILDVDTIAYYEDPSKKVERQIAFGQYDPNSSPEDFRRKFGRKSVEQKIRDRFGFEGEIVFTEHHMSHAASA